MRSANTQLPKVILSETFFRKLFWAVVFIALIIISSVLLIKQFFYQRTYRSAETILNYHLKTHQINERALLFTKLFVKEVLQSDKVVDFEARLKLENAIRSLDDHEITKLWNEFTDSKTEEEVQQAVAALLQRSVEKIKLQ